MTDTKTFLKRVTERFEEVAGYQEQKGIEKYGHELQPSDKKWDWLLMAEEELVDGYKYIQAEKTRRENKKNEITFRVTQLINFLNILEDEVITILEGYDNPINKDLEQINKMFDNARNKISEIKNI